MRMNREHWLAGGPRRNRAEMSDLGVFLYLHVVLLLLFLLVGGVSQFFDVRILDPMHQLYVLLQQQPLREGPPGVWAVSVSTRQSGELWLPRAAAHCGGVGMTAHVRGSDRRNQHGGLQFK